MSDERTRSLPRDGEREGGDAFPDRELTRVIIGCFYRVHSRLGYGFLESVYRRALWHELRRAGLDACEEVPVDVWYDGMKVGHFRADLLVAGRVVLELKATSALSPADAKQLLNYLRGTRLELGLLLHFGPRACFKRLVFSNARKLSQRAGS